MVKKRSFSNIAVLVALIVALLSCLAVNNTWARYSSEFDGEATAPTAKFIVDIKFENGNENLSVTPSPSGGIAAFEFTVSNADENSVSEINQMFVTGLLLTKSMLMRFSELEYLDAYLLPILLCTNDMDSSINEIYQYTSSGNIPTGVAFGMFQNFDIVLPDGDFDLSAVPNDEIFPATWFYDSNSDVIYGNTQDFLPQQNHGDAVVFSFNKDTANSVRFIVAFMAYGSLPEGKQVDFNGVQVVVYSEQVN